MTPTASRSREPSARRLDKAASAGKIYCARKQTNQRQTISCTDLAPALAVTRDSLVPGVPGTRGGVHPASEGGGPPPYGLAIFCSLKLYLRYVATFNSV
jgi:hypothetical protein